MTLRKLTALYAALLMALIASVLISYRYFVSLPALDETTNDFHYREIQTLHRALQKEIQFLKTINYDYAVWDDSYQFARQRQNQVTGDIEAEAMAREFIDENLLDDTFTSLKIDGIYYYGLDHTMLYGRGFDYLNNEPLGFSELNLTVNPIFKVIFPDQKKPDADPKKVPQKGGFLNTRQGPVMFSATALRNSNRSGSSLGVLVFIRKVRPGLIKSLQNISQLDLSAKAVVDPAKVSHIPKLHDEQHTEPLKFTRQRTIQDPLGQPVILLNITHTQSQKPELFDPASLLTLTLMSLVPVMLLLLVGHFVVTPITRSARYIRRMVTEQHFHTIKHKFGIEEFKTLSEDFNALIHTVNRQQKALEGLAMTDGLTQISNRRAFEQFIASSWMRMQRNGKPVAVLMCDIDHFKPYNDNYGHPAGDEALKQVAQTLASEINRASDMVARYGGEEFVLVLADSSAENCEYVVHIVLDTIRLLHLPHAYSEVADHITLSIGAAVVEEFDNIPLESNYDQLIKAADEALYRAKEAGRNRAVMVTFDAQSKTVGEDSQIF